LKKHLVPQIGKKEKSNIVVGFRAGLVRICIHINILFLAITSLKNPFQGLKILSQIRKKRQGLQGLPAISKFIKSGRRYFFSENFPGWPSAAFNGFFRSEIVRTSSQNTTIGSLTTVILAITSKCRLGCKHCYEWNNLSHIDVLSPENLKVIVAKLKSFGVHHIQLSGGEPLERFEDLTELVTFSRKGTDLWLLTSGFGLTFEKALRLKKAGLSGADISLDHWDEKEHNLSRNSNKSYYWVKEAVKNCKKAGIATTLSLCAFRSFVSHENIMKYAELGKEWGVGFIRLLEPRETGRFKGENVALGIEQVQLLENFYLGANSPGESDCYPVITYPGYHQRRVGCFGAGNRYLYIDPKGNIHACPFCQRSAGNAVSGSLEDAVSILRINGCQEFKMNISD
jgi:MoaA/NifB/PqqE/SkfB family radical SAM enzyme